MKGGKNMNKWKVAANHASGNIDYQVYRIKDETATDHAGNRDYLCILFDNKNDAQTVADAMNMVTEEAFGND